MLKGLLKNIDPSLEAACDMGASRWKVFTSVTLPLILPGLGNAFLVSFIESIADFANPMIIGGSYDIWQQPSTCKLQRKTSSMRSCLLLFFFPLRCLCLLFRSLSGSKEHVHASGQSNAS